MRDWKALVRARVGPLSLDGARDADIVAELAQHAADHFAELVANGIDDREAERLALAPLNDRDRVALQIAGADRPRNPAPDPPPSGGTALANIPRDVRYAVRLLRRSPGFAAAAIITLALGIGANAAIFSVVRAVILRPPPYHDASRVVAFLNGKTGATGSITSSSLPDYEDWRRQLTSFSSIGILSGWTFNATGLDLPERLFGARVSGSLFPLLGTPALLGRTIEPSDDGPSGDEVLVLGYRVWQRLFAGDPNVIGKPLMLEGRPHYIIGVMPARFRFPTDDTEVWAAIKNNMTGMPRNGRFMAAVARLKDGVSIAAAQTEVDTVEAQLEAAYPDTNRGWRVRLGGIHDVAVGDAKPALLTLVAAVGFVLLIACANVANLLLARATSRSRETAIRLALGASRRRIVAQWLTENLVLALTGGLFGVAIAFAVTRVIVTAGPPGVPRLDETDVDVAVLAFTFGISLVAGVLPALLPAFRAAQSSTSSSLKEGVDGSATTKRNRAGATLIVCEVALAMTLAVAGALLLKSYARLAAVRPGFDPAQVLSLKVSLTPPRYRTVAQSKQFIASALDRLNQISGVESAAAISQVPISDPSSTQLFDAEDKPTAPGDRPAAGYRAVSASYFKTMRISIVRGRPLTDDDRIDTPLVVVVNEATAKRVWPSENPIGKRIKWATGVPQFDSRWHTVVGVAADVKSNGLDRPEAAAIYAPYTQRMFPWLRWTGFVLRTHSSPDGYARIVRQELTNIDPMQPIYEVHSLEHVIAQSVSTRRFHTGLIDLFAALALGLASVGVYGTISYWVSERSREIGVRMALGADARSVGMMVVGRASVLTAAGIALGLALSIATSRLLTTLLFNVQPFDPPTVVGVATLVSGVAIAAAYIPARRAARLDPLTVIRGE